MRHFLSLLLLMFLLPAAAQAPKAEPVLGPGDVIKVSVFQSPDLAAEARISENGQINFPLIGAVTVGGLSVSAAERLIEAKLRDGGFVIKPQVTIQTVRILSSQISVLGQVGKPGRYPIETVDAKVSEMIAIAGGVVPGGADVVNLVGTRDGKPIKLDIDLPAILQAGRFELDVTVHNGDILFVDRAPSLYIYGEVQRPGQLRLERGMSLMQALAAGGGVSARGTQRGIRVHRKDASGTVQILELKPTDKVERDDVIYVRESIF
ncbi:MAG: polysaccharide export protein EpsE [Pseudomonadota bacterium]|nr:polysaccharide export protein EpsE [Pseudomonadota bacterium]